MSGLVVPQVPSGLTMEEYAEIIAKALKEIDWAFNGNISDQNISIIAGYRASATELKHISGIVGMSGFDPSNPDAVRFWAGDSNKEVAPYFVTQAGRLTATGAIIRSVASGYPKLELNGPNGLFTASKSDTEYIAISPSYTGSPAIRFISPNAEGFISAADLFGYVWFNVTKGHMYLQAQSGDIHLFASGDIYLDTTTGKAKVSSWSKVLNTASNQTLLDVFNNLQAQLDSKQNEITSGDVVIVDGDAQLVGTGVGAGTYTKVTVQSDGRVYSGTTLSAGDIPPLAQSQIANLTTDLAAKAPTASPTFTGTVTLPQSAWTNATLQNSWVNFGGVYATAAYRKDPAGNVQIKGLIKSGTITAGTTIFNLPTGFRPSQTRAFSTTSSNGSNLSSILEIDSLGNVKIGGGAIGNTFISLEIPPFYGEQ